LWTFKGVRWSANNSYGRKLPAPGLAVSNRLWISLLQHLTR
jgi:hypothetical protein